MCFFTRVYHFSTTLLPFIPFFTFRFFIYLLIVCQRNDTKNFIMKIVYIAINFFFCVCVFCFTLCHVNVCIKQALLNFFAINSIEIKLFIRKLI